MAIKRIYFLLIGLFLVLSVNTFAQKSPLVITGTFSDVKYTTKTVQRNGKFVKLGPYFEIRLNLVYYNRGETTLIVPLPDSFEGKRTLFFFDIPSSDSKSSATVSEWLEPGWLSPFGYDRASYLQQVLASQKPYAPYFAILEPGRFHETNETVRVTSGYKLEKRPSGQKSPPEIEFAIAEHPYFKIRYSRSIKDDRKSSEPMADAQRRWKLFGTLLLNSDGDFYFDTDIIINKLPD